MNVEVKYARKKIFFGESNNIVWRLIIANAVVFTALYFVRIVFLITGQEDRDFMADIMPWAVIPADLGAWVTRPWTLVTAMFVHEGFLELLTNMVWLWWFGTMLQDFAGHRKLFPLYLFGGLAGAFSFLALHYAFPGLHHLPDAGFYYGAGASIMAIAVTVTILVPNYRIFPMLNGGIPLWVISLVYLAVDIAGMPASRLTGHLGGAVMGLLFVWQLKKGSDWSSWASRLMDRIERVFDPEQRKATGTRMRLFYKQDSPPFRKIGTVPEKKVDELLDKINQEGYDSLSPEEKETLMRASRQDE